MEALNSSWTEVRIQRLIKLYHDGLSFGLIGRDLNVSRSAAIAKSKRLKLPSREPAGQRIARWPEAPKSNGHRHYRASAMTRAKRPVAEEFKPPVLAHRCTIEDLDNRSCRYPLWPTETPSIYSDRFYCGIPTADAVCGLPYCRDHALLCGTFRK
jgi:hypothetical protein